MVEPREPAAHVGLPGRPVVERARAEAAGDAGREDDRREARLPRVGGQDERDPEADGREEADLVEDAPKPRFHARRSGDHSRILRAGGEGSSTRVQHCTVATRSKQLNIGRLGEIAQVAVRHGFGYVFEGRRGRSARGRHADRARPASARDARRARPDVRQVRPAALDAARRRPAGHHRRAARAPGRRAAVPVRGCRARDPGGARPADRAALPRVRDRGARRGVDRPGSPRRAPERAPGRRQGAAAERAAPDRGRPPADVPGRAAREGARAGARLHRHARDRRRVRALDPPGARLPARGAQRRRLPPRTSPAIRTSRCRARTGATRAAACSRSSTWRACSSATSSSTSGRLEQRRRPRVPGRRDVDDDDLPARVLPRRPAPGEHPRALPGADRARRLRPRREADRPGHVAADAALHRRREREHRGAAAAARRPRRPLPEGARGGVPRRAARALLPLLRREPGRRSTRSRSSARPSSSSTR